jgi:ribosomal protein S18 acetylase RimI-like enzyme
MNPIVRAAGPLDVDRLAALKLATFRETFVDGFKIPYPPADLLSFEQVSYSPSSIAASLADRHCMTWVAAQDRMLIGYAQVGSCKLPHPDASPRDGELYQLYLRRGAQGLGLGKALLAVALGWLEANRPGPIWLGVWSGNEKAQRFYEKAGFAKVGDYKFPVGEWHDEEFIYRR